MRHAAFGEVRAQGGHHRLSEIYRGQRALGPWQGEDHRAATGPHVDDVPTQTRLQVVDQSPGEQREEVDPGWS